MHTRLVINNVGSGRVTPARTWRGGGLKPGFGAPDLHIGQSSGDVEAVLGAPDEQVRSAEELYYVYRSLGIDVVFGSSQRVNSLYFFAANIERHSHAAHVRLDAIGLGSGRSQIVSVLGQPNLAGGPVKVGRRMKSWLCYDSGVEFDLDGRNRVITIIIFQPKRQPPH